MQRFIKAVGAGKRRARDLSRGEAREAMTLLLGTSDDAQRGAFLLALRMKGESAEELAGFVDALESSQPSTETAGKDALDIDAHGDGREALPSLLPAAAAIAARAGLEIDVRIDRNAAERRHHLDEVFARLGPLPGVRVRELGSEHAGLKALFDLRARVGVRTFVGSLVKLWSPRRAPSRLVGIFHGPYHATMAQALSAIGTRGLVVQAPGGLPEPPCDKPSKMTTSDCPTDTWVQDPRKFVSHSGPLNPVTSIDERVAVNLEAIEGRAGPALETALLAAGAMLSVSGRASNPESGYKVARDLVANG